MLLDYILYLKKEIEKIIFIEIKKDIKLSLKEDIILERGEYPVLSGDLIDMAKKGTESISPLSIIKGIIYIIGCDKEFKYNDKYIKFLKSIPDINSFIIMEIEKNKEKNIKEALIYTEALCTLFPKKEYEMNRVYILMKLYDNTNYKFLEDEIVSSLKRLCEAYPDYALPHFHLGQYYLDKDIYLSKIHLNKCITDPKTRDESLELLKKIRTVEEYDRAVELVKEGNGDKALETLLNYIKYNPDNLDAKYFTSVALRQSGRYMDAIEYLNELLAHGELPEVYNEIGLNFASLMDFQSAIEYFKKSLKIKPDDSGIICNIGVCHLNLGQLDEAISAFKLAARINPKDEIAKQWLNRIKRGM